MQKNKSIDSPLHNSKTKRLESKAAYQNQIKKSNTGGMAIDDQAGKKERQ